MEVNFSNHLLKQVTHLESLAQDHVQVTFEDHWGGRLHNLYGQPVLLLDHPNKKKLFPIIHIESLVLQLPLVLALNTTEKSLALSFSHPPFRYIDNITPSLVFLEAEQYQFSHSLLMES